MTTILDFYFYIGSTYSHLSVARAEAVAAEQGVELRWVPFSVRTIMREQGNFPFTNKPVKLRYMWRDLERRARRLAVPFDGIPPYPLAKSESANHVATLASIEGWCPQFTQAAYRAWFLEKRDPGEPEVLTEILASLGHNAETVIPKSQTMECLDAYARQTERARQLGIFGSPTFVHDGEVFWGDDRLEEAVQWAAMRSTA